MPAILTGTCITAKSSFKSPIACEGKTSAETPSVARFEVVNSIIIFSCDEVKTESLCQIRTNGFKRTGIYLKFIGNIDLKRKSHYMPRISVIFVFCRNPVFECKIHTYIKISGSVTVIFKDIPDNIGSNSDPELVSPNTTCAAMIIKSTTNTECRLNVSELGKKS